MAQPETMVRTGQMETKKTALMAQVEKMEVIKIQKNLGQVSSEPLSTK